MAGSRLLGTVQGVVSLHRAITDIQHLERAREKAEALETYLPDAEASGVLGDARLADMKDLEAANLFNPNGLFIGAYQGRMIFYSGTDPIVTYMMTGAGKGRSLVMPALAHTRNRTLIVGDFKRGENAHASWSHRSETLGIACIALDPANISKRGNKRLNPFQALVDMAADGLIIDDEADEIVHIAFPLSPTETTIWPIDGARELSAVVLEFFAYSKPQECCPGGLFRFWNASKASFEKAFKLMTTCGFDNIERVAQTYKAIYEEAPKQFAAYRSAANKTLKAFASGKMLDKATAATDFSVRDLKLTPHTVYIITPSAKLSTMSIWVSLIVSYLIETLANAPGNIQTTLILDEFPQMPASPTLLKAVRMYREAGVQPWFISQSRETLKHNWTDDAIREFEGQAGLMTFKLAEDPGLTRDISYWSGTRSVVLHGHNHGGGKLQTASQSISESKRNVLQIEDIRALGTGKMILKVTTMPRLAVCDSVNFDAVVPWSSQIKDVRAYHKTFGGI